MSRRISRRRRTVVTLVVSVMAVGAMAAAAVAATSFTLKVAKHATVTSTATGKTTHPNVAVNRKGLVVYTLTGDSRKHPECTKSDGCFMFWPPVTVKSVKSLHKAAGVKGKLSTWKRNGFIQVLLDGHPLYTYVGDSQRAVATGEGLNTFGGTWHVRMASPAKGTTGSGTSTGTGTGGGW